MSRARRAASGAIELRLLGPLEATKSASRLSLGGPKPRALLALLALDVGDLVSDDRLVEELWSGAPPDSASHAIQVYVSQLRKAFGDAIVREGHGYRLALARDAVDAERFARLAAEGHDELRAGNAAAAAGTFREALALWRGPALADFTYEPFAQSAIARLDELRFGVLEDRVDADLALGRHAELVPEIEALVEAQPLRERPRALLMRALYLAGRQADALAAYRSARETLVEELGIEPGPELRELEAAILRQDDSLVPARPRSEATIRTRRLAAVLSVGLEADADDVELEDELLSRAAATVVAAVTRHGGVADRLADGSVSAVFGVPVAHEDDPVRAARAGVEAREALAATPAVTFRGAIEVGEVVAGEQTVSGPPIRAATRVREGAATGELLVGPAAIRRLDRLAVLEMHGDAATLVGLAEPRPGFARRPETKLVGRKRELEAIRRSLERAKDSRAAGAVLLVGPPGIGKSRLAAEFTRRSRGISKLWGGCLSYGDGITYWPIRDMLGQAETGPERDAVLVALDADVPPPATEIALLFRRLCEASALEKPLVLVFDDVHWAEPTLLDLVEHLVDKAEGSILVVCLGREELLEKQPDFLAARESVVRVELEGLSQDETETLLDQLDGAVLEPDQRVRLADAAEGNPLFVEQLLALALEGGLAERALPETIQALLTARLDRLGPGERAVLERGAVIGTEFTRDDVTSLLGPEVRSTVDAHLRTLADRGFVRGLDGSFAFRHVLVREAVYRSASKRLRAELHEQFADRLDTVRETSPDLDGLVGYHLERAHALRCELGERDRRTERLAEDAGRRLGSAGMRAWRRGDAATTVGLLERATRLLPGADSRRLELLCELGLALQSAGDAEGARASVEAALEHALALGDRRVELRARMEGLFLQAVADVGRADELAHAARTGIPVLETFGDDRGLGRAWLLLGWVRGGIQCQYEAWEAAAEQALVHYRRAGSPPATCLGQIAAALYWGPEPVESAASRCAELLAHAAADLDSRAHLGAYLGGLEAQRGNFDRARSLVADARQAYEDLGHAAAVATHCDGVAGDIELLAGDQRAAHRAFLAACSYFESTGYHSEQATRAADLAEALYCQDELDEADRWAKVSETHAADGFLSAELSWRPIRAKILARRGDVELAETVVRDAVLLADATDGLNRRAKVYRDLGEVLSIAAREAEATAAFDHAVALYERKGNVAGAARTHEAAEIAHARRGAARRGRPKRSTTKS